MCSIDGVKGETGVALMTWYAAHLIEYIKVLHEAQETFPLYENVVLIQAPSVEDAHSEAERIGRFAAENAGDIWLDERPSQMVFGGVRKLIECQDGEMQPQHGTEVSYSQMEAGSEGDITKLVQGEAVTVLYTE